jgi:quinolinate synthase
MTNTVVFPNVGWIQVLTRKNIGIVAHFYMDPEVQGVLSAAAKRWPHIYISDSLAMADKAVAMAKAGCTSVAVLGVDFMTENVRAVMDGANLAHVGVYRMASEKIGCSLAEAAEGILYTQYLEEAGATQGSNLHIIYINTSLRTKAIGQGIVPTITCTSSNVVNTVLQAAHQVPGVNIWYGPDTYMGGNLAELFRRVLLLGDAEIAKLHPEHNTQTIKSLLPRLRYFQDGTCIVHHLFGGDVCAAVRAGYSDAYQTAHFEVPGEMFELAMEARERGMGTVGSTSNILEFIVARVNEALEEGYASNLRFVLGTESGMITSIVNTVQVF